MGRYAYHGQEVLKRDGKLVGFNAGYGFYAEHESGYTGTEQMKPKKIIDKNKNHPFNGEIVENPKAINLMEFSDGKVWLTNDEWNYASLMRKTEEERHEIMDRYINNDELRTVFGLLSCFFCLNIVASVFTTMYTMSLSDCIFFNTIRHNL